MSTEFLLTSLVVVVVPGTGVLYTVSTGLSRGWRASLAATIGCTLGIVPHLLAAILGLSAILHMSAQVFQILKYVGSAYLLYLAWSLWRQRGLTAPSGDSSGTGGLRIAARGVLLNLLNPKLTLFFFAFLPLFMSPESSAPIAEMLGLSAVFMAMTLVIFALYGIAAGAVRSAVLHSPLRIRRVQRLFALALAGMALKLALSEQ
jgi:threonine/homoserine/homoserine lactone efflux protein